MQTKYVMELVKRKVLARYDELQIHPAVSYALARHFSLCPRSPDIRLAPLTFRSHALDAAMSWTPLFGIHDLYYMLC